MSKSSIHCRLAHAYHELAWMNLAIGLYDFYERYADGFDRETERELAEAVLSAVLPVLTEPSSAEAVQERGRLTALRESVTEMTGALSVLADRLRIVRYLMNRADYALRNDLPERDTEEEARKLLQYIFGSEDSVAVNERIRLMVSELPLRMTKQRFFDLLEKSLSVYQEGELSALDGFCERLVSAAGLSKKRSEAFSEQEALPEEFAALDYAALTREAWTEANERLTAAEDKTEKDQDFLCDLEMLLNDTLCISLVADRTEEASAAREQFGSFAVGLTQRALQGLKTGRWEPLPEEEDERFSWLEGQLERCSETVLKLESAFDSMPEKGEEPNRWLVVAEKLMSTSPFASLDAETSENVTPELWEARRQELFGRLEAAMAEKNRKYVRAMMAAVLGELPVFFDSRTDVMNYVLASLSGCGSAEKNAALDLLWELYEA